MTFKTLCSALAAWLLLVGPAAWADDEEEGDEETAEEMEEAARKALRRAGDPDPQRIGCVYVGSLDGRLYAFEE